MQYIGGKFRIAKFIVPVLNRLRGDRDYLEPFIGAANIFCKIPGTRIGSDSHPDLILLLQAVRDGTIAFPDAVSEEEYQRIRREPPSALRGFVGFGCSFAGKWFGGYARDPRSDRNYAISNRLKANAVSIPSRHNLNLLRLPRAYAAKQTDLLRSALRRDYRLLTRSVRYRRFLGYDA